jgi:nicotinate phosphoribosyltransferase
VDADHLIRRLVYGVGTRLITSAGDPALGGVYKLVAVQHENEWKPAIKMSESLSKTPNPGYKNLWRLYDKRGKATADLVALEGEDPRQMKTITLRHPTDQNKYRTLSQDDLSQVEPLLVQALQDGKLVIDLPSIEQIRKVRQADVDRLDPGVRRIMNPHIYHVSLTSKLWELKQKLIDEFIHSEVAK